MEMEIIFWDGGSIIDVNNLVVVNTKGLWAPP